MTRSDKLRKIKAVVLDVDGVLTDGRAGFGVENEIKFFHLRDGHWMKLAIRAGLNTVVPPLQQAVAGFSDLVLMVDFDLLEVLTEWNKMPTVEPYVKLDITRYLTIISKLDRKSVV